MTKQDRVVYLALAEAAEMEICSFCRFNSSSACEDYSICEHPLPSVSEHENWWQSDCWAFRPAHPVDVIADIVGLILVNGWELAMWWKRDDGTWAISGQKG